MMKATIETSLMETRDVTAQDSIVVIFDNLVSSVKRILQLTFLRDKWTGRPVTGKNLQNRGKSSLFVAFLRQQQRKTQLVDQAIKDEFFFRRNTRRRNISQRTWNRHSAFLFYRQQVNKQMRNAVSELEKKADTVMEGHPQQACRMSFRVKSIKPLPVWASACHELTRIESDLSSLSLMEYPRTETPAAEAA